MNDVAVRDAHPDDADAIAGLADAETGVVERLLRERRVRVAAADDELVGVLAYDVSGGAVHVTRLVGSADAAAALLEEPVAFARAESMPVEAVVPVDEDGALAAVTDAGFDAAGDGPMFAGERTERYRLSVAE